MQTPISVLSAAGGRRLPVAAPRVVLLVGLAALTALAAQIRIPLPFTPVPVTGQVFVVALAGYIAGPWGSALSMAGYLVAGACGLPVFSGLAAGGGLLAGPTGGYLLAYPPAAMLTGLLSRRFRGSWGRVCAGFAGLGVVHVAGALWLAGMFPGEPAGRILAWSLMPFIGLDLVKVMLAERLTRGWASRPQDLRATP